MKLFQSFNDDSEASDLAQLLENNGIPSKVTGLNIEKHGPFIPDSIEVWVYNDSQYSEAIKLYKNKNYIVQDKVDIEAFYKSIDSQEYKEILSIYKDKFIKYGLLFIAGAIVIMLFSVK